MHLFILLSSLFFQQTPLTIISPDFENEGRIPSRFTCDGERINPTLIINGIPEGTISLALIAENVDALEKTITQWVVWNIKPTEAIFENTIPGVQGVNSTGKTGYLPPCPQEVSQRYVFKIYALNTTLTLRAKANRKQLEAAMQGHILITGNLVGEYNRSVVATGKVKNKK